ncbi:carbohydrate ABC transporter permease [Pseudarthrobacter sp. Fe7]|nr:carbohydrate ABC transporter permease [Pseudarthrobacter sp. Fe7]
MPSERTRKPKPRKSQLERHNRSAAGPGPDLPIPAGVLPRRRCASNAWLYAAVVLVVLFCLLPFYWMLVSSLKSPGDILDNQLIPTRPTMMNYGAVFSDQNTFALALKNSLFIAGSVTLIALLFGIFASYALARLNFKAKNIVLATFLATSMFPGVAILTPLFQLFADMGWIDTYQAMIIPDISFSLPLGVWILTSFFRAMPWELEAAARVDGCTPLQAFRQVILPLAVPGVFTTAILIFISAWNEFMIANSISQTPASQPVTVAIAQFTGVSQYDQPFGTQMAAGVIVTVPLIIVVLIFQRRIVSGLTAGGVK